MYKKKYSRPNTEMQFTDRFHRTDCHIYNNYYDICTNNAAVHNIVLILNLSQGKFVPSLQRTLLSLAKWYKKSI